MEEESLEEEKLNNQDSIYPPTQKLQILTHVQPKIQEVEEQFESHKNTATQTLKPT